jgi:hypothetical protein
MWIAELTTGWLTACCLACTLSHCGARGVRALSMFIDTKRTPLQLGWSPSPFNRPRLSDRYSTHFTGLKSKPHPRKYLGTYLTLVLTYGAARGTAPPYLQAMLKPFPLKLGLQSLCPSSENIRNPTFSNSFLNNPPHLYPLEPQLKVTELFDFIYLAATGIAEIAESSNLKVCPHTLVYIGYIHMTRSRIFIL